MWQKLDQWLLELLYRGIGEPPIVMSLSRGASVRPPLRVEPIGHMRILDRGTLFRLLFNPDLYFGEGYTRGTIEIEGDLVGFFESCYRAMRRRPPGWLLGRIRHWQARPRGNSLEKSKDNIYHHYDIGNDFYRLWLDSRAMQYTCAYYPMPEASLEEAQIAKMDHIARKLQLKPGDSVIEAGCGWGGLALHLVKNYGVKVRAYNISREQIAWAREQARKHGVGDRLEYIEDDYRNISGKYDVFVSVGMLEHIGKQNYRQLGEVIARCLREDGRGLIHSIGRISPARMSAWVERNIFPGAYPPSLQEAMEIFEPWRFSILDVENIRLHYARTLEQWLERFDEHAREIGAMYDRDFLRAWRLYLAGSAATFACGELQLFQMLFAPGDSNEVPWTRDYMYAPAECDTREKEFTRQESEWKRAMH